MVRAIALRIDIEEELAAIARGECALCRIIARHPDDSTCPNARALNAAWDEHARKEAQKDDEHSGDDQA